MSHDAGLFEPQHLNYGGHSMRSVVHLPSSEAQPHGHVPELQNNHGVRGGGRKQHPHEVDVRRLQAVPIVGQIKHSFTAQMVDEQKRRTAEVYMQMKLLTWCVCRAVFRGI